VVIIEGNLSKVTARTIARVVEDSSGRDYQPVECLRTQMKTNGDIEPFIWVDGFDAKERFHMWLNRLLTNEALFISDDLVAVAGTHPRIAIDALYTQMRNVRVVTSVRGNHHFDQMRRTISGKGGGQQDDLAMAMMFGAFWGGMHEMNLALERNANAERFSNHDVIEAHKEFRNRIMAKVVRRQ
jgi:hypothetical protein